MTSHDPATASGPAAVPPGQSWSGTVDYGPGPLHVPTTLAELQTVVGRCRRIRALGTRHSFSEIGSSDADLVTLAGMPEDIDVDTTARTVRVGAGVRYGELALAADRKGLAVRNMGSLPHISVGGASATGTHGSGDGNQVLSASVRAVEMVTADGDLITLSREQDPEAFGGAVLALGMLGVLTHLTIDLVPAFDMRQVVYLRLPPDGVSAQTLDELLAGGYSVSLFHQWNRRIDQIWVKQAVGAEPSGSSDPFPATWHGARLSTGPVHPLPGMPAEFCTDQSGNPGPSHERLPHFRMEFMPSNGEEIQSEYFVARDRVAEALAAVMPLGDRLRPLLHASEVRTVAADDLWLSPAYGRDSACIHFTWKRLPAEVQSVLPRIEEALAPLAPRPHWGKVFTMAPESVRSLYPRFDDTRALRDRLDPQRVFSNAYVDRLIGS